VTRTFSAPHSSQIILILGNGGASPGFATILFQHSKQIHFSRFAFSIIIPPLMIEAVSFNL
jgi:hypothetical protein